MLTSAWLALSEILTPPFRSVLWKSLGFTIALLIGMWFGLQALAVHLISLPDHPFIATALAVLTGFGLILGLGFLVAPITSLFAGLFSDEIAAVVERTHYPQDPPGTDLAIRDSAGAAVRFTVTVVIVNILCLFLLLVPGINLIAFFVANGYLLGREFFEAAAARFRPVAEARALRQQHAATVFFGGVVIAAFLAIPIVNLLTPLFATAFMTHLHKRLTGSRPAIA